MAKVEIVVDLKRRGNHLWVLLPAAIARVAHLRAHQPVKVAVVQSSVVITPVEAVSNLSLGQRLARFDPAKHRGEAMVTGPVGAEKQ